MWKQSTFFGFVAGALITLSLQSLTAVGLFRVPDPNSTAPLSTQQSANPNASAATSSTGTTQSAPSPIANVDFAEHLTFSPFILVAAGMFFFSGAFYFVLSSTSAKFENTVSELTTGTMTTNEKSEIEAAVFVSYRSKLIGYFSLGTIIGVLGFVALMFRV